MKFLRRLWDIMKYEYRLTLWRVRNFEHRRTSHVAFIVAILLTILAPVVSYLNLQERYRLSADTTALVGQTLPALTAKLDYDKQSSVWQFNAKGEAKLPDGKLMTQVGGAGVGDDSLYSLSFPDNSSKGITYTDNQSKLAFTMTPQFGVMDSHQQGGRMIFPTSDGRAQLVYTPMNNGLKEDIVLAEAPGDELQYEYKLNLPGDLSARMNDDGSVGIYSADRALFGDIQYGGDTDRAKVESARKSAVRNTMIFAIPAPVIKQSPGKQGSAKASFSLMSDVLTLNVAGLKRLNYPISIDPSVVITSSSDFSTGNNEGNIDFASNQINRGALTGGDIGNYVSGAYSATWTSATNTFTANSPLTGGRMGGGSVAYNGYLYVFGGGDTTNKGADVQCSLLSTSTGQPGTWSTSSNTLISPASATNTGRQKFGYAMYNGYLYIGAGTTNAGNQDDVFYAALTGASNCVGAFTQTTAFNTTVAATRQSESMVAYNGYMYMAGGLSGGSQLVDVQYAPINGDGTIGSWTNSSNLYSTGRYGTGLMSYNGYLYVVGGRASGSYLNDIQYSPINTDGSLGSFITNGTTFATARFSFAYAINNGYMYITGGVVSGGGSTITGQYASINANGSVGTWVTTGSQFTTSRETMMFALYNGYFYIMGGEDNNTTPTTWYADAKFAKIDAAGQINNMTATTAMTSGTGANGVGTGITGASSIAYNGYLYTFGGFYSSDYQGKVLSSSISAGGTVGSWTANTALPAAKGAYGFAYYNGCAYLIGGFTTGSVGTSTVYYTCFPDTGNTLTWSTGTSIQANAENHQAAAYNGYIYYLGQSGGGTADTSLEAIQITNGSGQGSLAASWSTVSNTLSTGVTSESLVAYNGYLYVIGGQNGTTYYDKIQYAPISAGNTTAAFSTTDATNSGGKGYSLNDIRSTFQAAMINGYLYVMGGEKSNSVDLATGEYSLLDASTGAPGPWTRTTTFSVGTAKNFGMAVSNGFIYTMCGTVAGSRQRTTYMFTINHGGAPSISSWTTNGTSLSTPYTNGWAYGATYAANGYLYTIGGYNSTHNGYTSVYSAPLSANGSVGSWTSTNSMNTARYNFGFSVANGYMYVMGGTDTSGNALNSVEYAQINTGGTVGTWTASGNNMTQSKLGDRTAVYNNRLYVLGGTVSGSTTTTVESATINASTGAVGTWSTTNMTALSTATTQGQAFAYNGYIYYLGGYDGTNALRTVYYATLDPSTGAMGSWNTTESLESARYYFSLSVRNNYVFITGGTGSAEFNDTEEASIQSNGTLSLWENSLGAGLGFTTARHGNASYLYNGYLYTLGGFQSSTYDTDVQYTPVNLTSRAGLYTKLVDLGALYNLSSITYNGTVPYISNQPAFNTAGTVTYRSAGTNGVFGSSANVTSITPPATFCSTGTARYVWISVLLDDGSVTSVFPDVSTSYPNVTDVTVFYPNKHPTPDIRLYQGKYFENQALQPLDTCGP